jgi:hypothetical protein
MQPPIDVWLLAIANHLRGKGLTCELAYDDYRLGNLLALSVPTPQGLGELDVRRQRKGAVLIVCAESVAALRVVTDTLGPLHETVRRLENAKRKFVHRIERMVEHLEVTFEDRAQHFPKDALERVRELFPEAAPMTGIEALFRAKEHEPESVKFVPGTPDRRVARQARRYPSRFAVKIPRAAGERAALYQPESGLFLLRGDVEKELAARLQDKDNRSLASFALIRETKPPAATAKPVRPPATASTGTGTNGTTTLNAISGCADCAICLPDCNAVDVPDFSGCDLSGCSFSS